MVAAQARGGEAGSLYAKWGYSDVRSFAESAVNSGLFKNVTSVDIAVVIIEMGLEAGVPPAAALKGIQIIEGKPEYAPVLLMGIIENSGKGYVKVARCDSELCELHAYVKRPTGEYELQEPIIFGVAEAEGITNYDRTKQRRVSLMEKGSYANGYLSDMFFARAAGRVARRYFPHVTLGAVYGLGEIQDMLEPDGASDSASMDGSGVAEGDERGGEAKARSAKAGDGLPSTQPKPKASPASSKQPEPTPAEPLAIVDPSLPDITPTDPESPEYHAWHAHLSLGEKRMIGSVQMKQLATYLNNNKAKISADEDKAIKLIIEYKKAKGRELKNKMALEAAKNAQPEAVEKVVEVFPEAVVEKVKSLVPLHELGETKMIGSQKYQGVAWKQVDPEYLEGFVKKNRAILPEGYAEDAERYLDWRREVERVRQEEVDNDNIPEFDVDNDNPFQEP